MTVQMMPVDPNAGIPDLIHRLADDSKRIVADEVRLAKLELRESVHESGKGAMLLGIAFALTAAAIVMLTLLIVTLIGRFGAGHMWLGAVITGVVELVVGAWLVRRGLMVTKRSVKERSS
jgi:Protein of unknown function (DUF1469).